ncbi:MAG: hypothetical protein BWZ03_00756 [bacterium ADurb.BinA186]|nr:MAG: hypothetical protein BWZ03_00756 [bacterium ADurb.BinA186]
MIELRATFQLLPKLPCVDRVYFFLADCRPCDSYEFVHFVSPLVINHADELFFLHISEYLPIGNLRQIFLHPPLLKVLISLFYRP